MSDEHYIGGSCWQVRNYLDRRFWSTSGGWPNAIGYGVTNDHGDIQRTDARPFDEAVQ